MSVSYNADSIIVLEGLEAVRKRPGMYIGSTGVKGLNHLVYEIVDNAIDEHLAGFCNLVQVVIHNDGSVSVSDNGRGIPVGMHKKGVSAERIVFTTLHAGGKFDNKSYKVSGGLHGVGSSVVNALSEWLRVEVKSGGKIHVDKYKRGLPDMELKNGLLPTTGKTSETGTTISFLPDAQIFDTLKFKTSSIKDRLHEITYLNPNLTITYKNEIENEEFTYSEPDGLAGYIKELNSGKEPISDVISYSGEQDGVSVDCVFQFVNSFEENILGFCNDIFTAEGGTHITGFKNKFTATINSYARELNILKEKDENFTGTDARSGITAIVAICHPDPLFEGQTKTKLGNADAVKAVSSVTGEQLPLYLDKNIEQLKKIISCAERSAKLRKTEMKNKANMLEKQKFSFESNGQLANCESKDALKNEVFIVEGRSAGGSAKSARNRKHQAIMPIRGKILNVEKATMDKVLKNEEIKAMITAFGCGMGEGYGNDFDISKLKYNKIIIMADADIDGSHISTLLLTFFYRFVPDLIKAGHVYRAMPPLYKATTVKNKDGIYIYTDEELEKFRTNHKITELQRYKGLGEMDPEQLWETTMNPATRFLKQIEIEDAIQATQTTELLMGTNIEIRKDFIYKNALSAELDI